MNREYGAEGEKIAAEYLVSKGFEIITRNYHSRFGEIDIIAKDSRYLVFAEVKTRTAGALVAPFEAVTAAKRRKIVRTTMLYLQSRPTALQPRFDVIGVTVRKGTAPSVSHIENAFDTEGLF